MNISWRTQGYFLVMFMLGNFQHSSAEDMQSDTQANVLNLVAAAGNQLPALGLTQFGTFSVGSANIAGTTYPSALSTTVNVNILNTLATNMALSVNPRPSDLALKITGQLPIMRILGDQFYLKACCNKSGGPELNLEIQKNNIRSTLFVIRGAVAVFLPQLDLDADITIGYENGMLSGNVQKNTQNFNADLTIKLNLPDPRQGATGIYFNLSGNLGKLIQDALTPLLRQAVASVPANACETTQIKVDTGSVGGFFGSISRGITSNVKTVMKNPQACSQKLAADAALNVINALPANFLTVETAVGSWTIDDMRNARAPMLTQLRVNINVGGVVGARTLTLPAPGNPPLQFDFKRPDESAKNIARELVSQVKPLIGL